MKRLPRKIPPRYQKEWKEDEKEWRFRKKVRYVNAEGKKDKQAIIQTLDKLGIDEKKAKRKTTSLSGGEQQRVAIARSIMTDSKIIIADEPTGNLDYKSADEVIRYLRQLADNGKCVIMVTHNEKYTEAADVVLRIDQEEKTIRYDTLAKR